VLIFVFITAASDVRDSSVFRVSARFLAILIGSIIDSARDKVILLRVNTGVVLEKSLLETRIGQR
jgi:hypothetical protein